MLPLLCFEASRSLIATSSSSTQPRPFPTLAAPNASKTEATKTAARAVRGSAGALEPCSLLELVISWRGHSWSPAVSTHPGPKPSLNPVTHAFRPVDCLWRCALLAEEA